jgi:type I restriction enzyme S subunit
MREGWRRSRLADGVTIAHGYAFPGSEFTTDPALPTLVTPGNFRIGGGFQGAKIKTFSGAVPAEYVLKAGDVVVTMTDLSKSGDTLGYSAKVPPGSYLHNQRIGLVRVLEKSELDLEFAYWLMRTGQYRSHVLGGATGSTVRHTSPRRILDFRFDLPPLPEQRRIAGVLGALDDLIDTNQRLLAYFVAIEAASYRFAKLQSASRRRLGDLFQISSGKFLPKADRAIGTIPVFGSNGVITKTGKSLFEDPVLVVGRVGACGQVHRTSGPAWVSDNALVVRPADDSLVALGYQILTDVDYAPLVQGTTQPMIRGSDLKDLMVQVPDDPRLATTLQQSYAAQMQVQQENSQLRQTRDELLPLLMSGAVSPAEVVVGS